MSEREGKGATGERRRFSFSLSLFSFCFLPFPFSPALLFLRFSCALCRYPSVVSLFAVPLSVSKILL